MGVAHGRIGLHAQGDDQAASVTAVIGPNGSGKTTVIDAVGLLSTVMLGLPLPVGTRRLIRVGSSNCRLRFGFELVDDEGKSFDVDYELSVRAVKGSSVFGTEGRSSAQTIEIFDEILRLSDTESEERSRPRPPAVISTADTDIFGPDKVFRKFIKDTGIRRTDIFAKRLYLSATGTSFFFSEFFFSLLASRCAATDADTTVRKCRWIIERLRYFAQRELFIVKSDSILPYGFLLPMRGVGSPDSARAIGTVFTDTNTAEVPVECLPELFRLTASVSMALSALMPGFRIKAVEGMRLLSPKSVSQQLAEVELTVAHDGFEQPLHLAPEGVRRAVRLLPFLSAVFSRQNVIVVIDGFEAGLYEPAAAALLSVLTEQGSGQLIMTTNSPQLMNSLDRAGFVVTTANPENRYVSMLKEGSACSPERACPLKVSSNQTLSIFGCGPDREDLSRALRDAG